MEKTMVLLIGPSGSGKTATAEYLEKKYSLQPIASYTTRPPRYEGENGHCFISEKEFGQLGNLVAYTVFDGFQYGVTADQIDQSDVYVVDIGGAETLYANYKGNKHFIVIYLDTPSSICVQRMADRGDGGLEIASRVKNDAIAFRDWNTRLSSCYEKIYPLEPDTIENIGETVWKIIQQNTHVEAAKPILHTTGCPVCKAVKSALDAAGIDYDVNTDIQVMKQLGISSVPILQVEDKLLTAGEAFAFIKKTSGN